jgi:hypothetical protein
MTAVALEIQTLIPMVIPMVIPMAVKTQIHSLNSRQMKKPLHKPK